MGDASTLKGPEDDSVLKGLKNVPSATRIFRSRRKTRQGPHGTSGKVKKYNVMPVKFKAICKRLKESSPDIQARDRADTTATDATDATVELPAHYEADVTRISRH